MRVFQSTIILLLFSALAANGQAFKHPLLKHLPNYDFVFTETKFDNLDVPVSEVELMTISGQKTIVGYAFNHRSSIHPNNQQLIRSYGELVKQNGGESVYWGSNYATYKVNKNGQDLWLILEAYKEGEQYNMVLLKSEEQASGEVSKYLAEINAKGHLAMYFNFASAASALPADAMPTITELVKLMETAPDLHIRIEGHTDNVGSPETNKKLSEDRAVSVMQALVQRGISPSRMQALGYGQEKPIADNRTEQGKKKNRRVELVKIK